ncbi:flagellar hook protein FlgE [Modestobacter lapidis]|nr:flagellar hook protein FlgE [Modestobacter lapidis]
MLRSMFAGVAGLKAHQTKMDVVGNNIANVNTVGFKSSQTVFEDTLSQVLRNGSAPNGGTAGTNPAQVGLGVKVAGITTNFGQGSQQNTGRASDFMIGGDGFFVTKVGNENLYTRAGSFDFDGVGNLVTPGGGKLQGWMVDANGGIDTNGPIEDLKIQFGQVLPPEATTGSSVVGNLSAEAAVGDAIQTQAEMYDALGNPHQVDYTFTKTAAGWDLTVADGGNTLLTTQLTFGTTGATTGRLTSTSPQPLITAGLGSWPGPVQLDLSGVTQFGGKTTAAAVDTDQSGSALGTLESYSLSGDGTIMGLYSNGLRQPLGQLALANFTNPGGLEKAGSSSYRAADNSGNAVIGVPGAGGRGTLTAGALEMSNVDLAEEFTGLIIAQRGFQANSKVITASDELLSDLVNLKR